MALNPEIVQMVAAIQNFAVVQGVSEKRAFQVALVRLCKAWATGQTVPDTELNTVTIAVQRLAGRLGDIQAVVTSAQTTVQAAHQVDVDAIVTAAVIPE